MPAKKPNPSQANCSTLRGIITINVFETHQQMFVENVDGRPLTYQELVGALEITRLNLVIAQTKINKAAVKKRR